MIIAEAAYAVVMVGVWCAGAFGIGIRHRQETNGWAARYGAFTALAGLVWPVTIPLYFAFKKGSFYGPQGVATKAKSKQVYISRGPCQCGDEWVCHDMRGVGQCTVYRKVEYRNSSTRARCACEFYAPAHPEQDVMA